jgi:hypothetical protein
MTWQLSDYLSLSTLCSVVITLIAFAGALIKLKAAKKNSETSAAAQIDLLSTMTEKLGTYSDVITLIQQLLDKVSTVTADVTAAITASNESNVNLANFVLECFNSSNLSDETKAKLQLLCDQLFYKDNSQLAENLKASKDAAEKLLTEKSEEIDKLKTTLAETTAKLEAVQSTVKKSRRIS